MMTEHPLSLAQIFAGWDVYHQHLVAAIAPLTSEHLALRSASHTWPVGMITAHIIATRVWWVHHWMGVGTAELTPLGEWDEESQPVREAAELVTGLERSWQMIQEALSTLTVADLARTFLYPDPTKEQRRARSCQWILWHVLEHDIHHGGELSSILGAHGLAAVNLE